MHKKYIQVTFKVNIKNIGTVGCFRNYANIKGTVCHTIALCEKVFIH